MVGRGRGRRSLRDRWCARSVVVLDADQQAWGAIVGIQVLALQLMDEGQGPRGAGQLGGQEAQAGPLRERGREARGEQGHVRGLGS